MQQQIHHHPLLPRTRSAGQVQKGPRVLVILEASFLLRGWVPLIHNCLWHSPMLPSPGLRRLGWGVCNMLATNACDKDNQRFCGMVTLPTFLAVSLSSLSLCPVAEEILLSLTSTLRVPTPAWTIHCRGWTATNYTLHGKKENHLTQRSQEI